MIRIAPREYTSASEERALEGEGHFDVSAKSAEVLPLAWTSAVRVDFALYRSGIGSAAGFFLGEDGPGPFASSGVSVDAERIETLYLPGVGPAAESIEYEPSVTTPPTGCAPVEPPSGSKEITPLASGVPSRVTFP